jgi:hypothetical protein
MGYEFMNGVDTKDEMINIENLMKEMKLVKDYRQKLIDHGKKVSIENPDKLNDKALKTLSQIILDDLDELDRSLGFEPHKVKIVDDKDEDEDIKNYLFREFVDWYRIIDTPSNIIYDYVIKNYPVDDNPNVLCVGDGLNCHLGRKLAMEGYEVISIDPVARTDFDGMIGKGYFEAFHRKFSKDNKDYKKMVNWASIIVGSKVPMLVNELVGIEKPTIFNISTNAEVHNIIYNGIKITSSEVLDRELSKTPGVERIELKGKYGDENIIYRAGERIKNEKPADEKTER